ncbi:F-box protein at1g19070 [Phtheirospermum japonicum]|uniref:F-box protein at1g19070 n=1 Tax=Phtheirospermum japonicum TaxID=374723 RepID=A0A830BQ23_9LAMI|nr:F-box protein at1g19070 [Phtheirospermum japonicum]
MEKDMISQLLDDILISIVGRVPTKEAVRTSILSKRWRNIYKLAPNVHLQCPCLFSGDSICHPNSNMFIDEVCRFLSFRSGFKIRKLSLHCCYMRSHGPRFEQFISSLGRLDIERLDLRSELSFSCHHIPKIPSLKYLEMEHCALIVMPSFRKFKLLNQSNSSSLQVIRLSSINVDDDVLEYLLANCLSLHSLEFRKCDLPTKLCVRGPNLQLKSLCIRDCSSTEEIELYASNLVTFECWGLQEAKLIFDYLPKLQNISLDFKYRIDMFNVCMLFKDLPHLKSSEHSADGDCICPVDSVIGLNMVGNVTMGFNTFADLRQLSLRLINRVSLLLLVPFLEKCPLLQEFHLNTEDVEYIDRGEMTWRAHPELKKVKFTGHSGTKSEMEFALYILKSAICLEQMHIKWRWRSETPRSVREEILTQLQDLAISNKAQLTLEY